MTCNVSYLFYEVERIGSWMEEATLRGDQYLAGRPRRLMRLSPHFRLPSGRARASEVVQIDNKTQRLVGRVKLQCISESGLYFAAYFSYDSSL